MPQELREEFKGVGEDLRLFGFLCVVKE